MLSFVKGSSRELQPTMNCAEPGQVKQGMRCYNCPQGTFFEIINVLIVHWEHIKTSKSNYDVSTVLKE